MRPEDLDGRSALVDFDIKGRSLTWYGGSPPHVGWWLAGYERMRNVWRWWDGEQWSRPAYDHQPAQHAAICALRPDSKQGAIFWSPHYPEGARVPRVAP